MLLLSKNGANFRVRNILLPAFWNRLELQLNFETIYPLEPGFRMLRNHIKEVMEYDENRKEEKKKEVFESYSRV